MAGNGEVRRTPRGTVAEQGAPVRSAAAVARFSLEPSDQERMRKIRSNPHQILATRSRSDGPILRVPLQPGRYAKEPLPFFLFNPQS